MSSTSWQFKMYHLIIVSTVSKEIGKLQYTDLHAPCRKYFKKNRGQRFLKTIVDLAKIWGRQSFRFLLTSHRFLLTSSLTLSFTSIVDPWPSIVFRWPQIVFRWPNHLPQPWIEVNDSGRRNDRLPREILPGTMLQMIAQFVQTKN